MLSVVGNLGDGKNLMPVQAFACTGEFGFFRTGGISWSEVLHG
jgi:hypothetical protein